MNFNPRKLPRSALPEVIDVLLADIAIRVQLTKTDHDKAVGRFEVMWDWIDRQGSPQKSQPVRRALRRRLDQQYWPTRRDVLRFMLSQRGDRHVEFHPEQG